MFVLQHSWKQRENCMGMFGVFCASVLELEYMWPFWFYFQSEISTTLYMKKYITYKHTFKYNNNTWNTFNLVRVSLKLTFRGVTKSHFFHFDCCGIKIECSMSEMYFKKINQSLQSICKIRIKELIISIHYGPISLFLVYQFRLMADTTFSSFLKIKKLDNFRKTHGVQLFFNTIEIFTCYEYITHLHLSSSNVSRYYAFICLHNYLSSVHIRTDIHFWDG